jgi:DtxR family Mn-dependent transcriptional regulator
VDWLIGSAIATLVVLAPRIGVLAWLGRRRLSRRREDEENALKHLLHQQYEGQQGSFASLAGALRLTDRSLMSLMQRLEERGLVERRGQAFALTVDGERLAVHVVRAHRLLERYLADEARLPLERLHAEAERREHALSPEDVDRLDASLGYPATDPHGDPIPTREGAVRGHGGKALTDWTPGTAGRIVHLEDESARSCGSSAPRPRASC